MLSGDKGIFWESFSLTRLALYHFIRTLVKKNRLFSALLPKIGGENTYNQIFRGAFGRLFLYRITYREKLWLVPFVLQKAKTTARVTYTAVALPFG